MRNSQKPRTDQQRAADAGLTLDEWIEAMEEAREGRGKRYDTVDEMFADLED